MHIEPIAAFRDNYIWCLREGSQAVVVDPGDAAPVRHHCEAAGLELSQIWITHHHPDHVGGVAALRQLWSDLTVSAPADSPFTDCDRALREGDTVDAFGVVFDVLPVPGHTLDHIALVALKHSPPLLFCGDTLFAGGCGRLFEGSPEQMYRSLSRLTALPADTAVYCAHEYTGANLAFAHAVEPGNPAVATRIAEVEATRAADRPTVPSSIALELATNPFLRCDQPELRESARRNGARNDDPVSIFSTLRHLKDEFR